jgi:hypothetical protein
MQSKIIFVKLSLHDMEGVLVVHIVVESYDRLNNDIFERYAYLYICIIV